MNAFQQISILLVQVILGAFSLIVLLRFILQIVKSDFYNPICQAIVKFTNPSVLFLRKFVPSIFNLDTSCLVLLYLVVLLENSLLVLITGGDWNVIILGLSVISTLMTILNFYFWVIIIYVVVSWFQGNSYNPNPAFLLLGQIVSPVLNKVRKFIPNIGAIDLSPIVVLLGIQILSILLMSLFK